MKLASPPRVRIRFVDSTHYVCASSPCEKRLPPNALKFWKERLNRVPATNALVATCDGRVVGFLRYRMASSIGGDVALATGGTWVDPSFRNRGIGTRMWRRMIVTLRPPLPFQALTIYVTTVSERGAALVASMKLRYPDVEWEVDWG